MVLTRVAGALAATGAVGVVVIAVGCGRMLIRSRNAIARAARLASMRSRTIGSTFDATISTPYEVSRTIPTLISKRLYERGLGASAGNSLGIIVSCLSIQICGIKRTIAESPYPFSLVDFFGIVDTAEGSASHLSTLE